MCGAGEATLVDDLLARGFTNVTVLDISSTAIEANRKRLGNVADLVRWVVADVTRVDLESAAYDVWHDRAVFRSSPKKVTAPPMSGKSRVR